MIEKTAFRKEVNATDYFPVWLTLKTFGAPCTCEMLFQSDWFTDMNYRIIPMAVLLAKWCGIKPG